MNVHALFSRDCPSIITRAAFIALVALVCSALASVADARGIRMRTYDELDRMSDVIVIAKPVSTKVTAGPITTLKGISPDIPVVGLSSEFEIIVILKGDSNLKKLVVHHYQLANPDEQMGNPPVLAAFDPTESTRYLLFLQREPDGRFAPIDQIDPAWTSLFKLSGAAWDKMTADDLKKWMDAKRWLKERPPFPGSELSSEITFEGRADGSLHEAAMNGKLEKARALINADPGLVFSDASMGSHTPLDFAVQYGHRDVAELLLANGADIEAKSYGGSTPLQSAVCGGHKDMVELLLAHKANVNYQEDAGRSPLHVAAENGYTEITALLLANGAVVSAKNREGYTPLHIAAALGRKDLVKLLVANKAEYNIQDAATIGDLERVKTLVKGNPDLVFSTDFTGVTALHWAVTSNQKDIVKFLLANQADVNAKAKNSDMTPLNCAVMFGRKDIVELLLAGGADVNVRSKNETPLHLAVKISQKEIADLLRQHGGQE
jgi:ankyrin repeat protein